MNERIQELAKQAYVNVITTNGMEHIVDGCYIISPNKLEKFAQLIVQECIDIIAPYTVRMSRPGEEYLHPILEIKQHFGVEE